VAKVAKIRALIPLVNNPKNMIGIGTTKGSKETRTTTTNSSANMFPKSQKLSDKRFCEIF